MLDAEELLEEDLLLEEELLLLLFGSPGGGLARGSATSVPFSWRGYSLPPTSASAMGATKNRSKNERMVMLDF